MMIMSVNLGGDNDVRRKESTEIFLENQYCYRMMIHGDSDEYCR